MYRTASRLGALKQRASSYGLSTCQTIARLDALPPEFSLSGVDIPPQINHQRASSYGLSTCQTIARLDALPPEFSLSGVDIPPQLNHEEESECMGHQRLAFCTSSGRMSKRMLPLGTHKRTLSSMAHEAPVITQLVCCDDYEIGNERWCFLAECLAKDDGILKPISPTGLMRPEDVISCGDYETGPIGGHFLRQATGLIAANLMRGRNVSKLMKIDNLLWAPERKILMFKERCLVGDNEDAECPYRALYDAIDTAVELATGYKLENLPYALPWQLQNFLDYLLDARFTDKRLITNHSVTRYPSERIQRNMTMNHVLRRKLGYEFRLEGWQRSAHVLEDIGKIFPMELLTAEGLQPAIDYWARKAAENRGDFAKFPNAVSPVVSPVSSGGKELFDRERRVALGKILVALMRDPFEHPYEPAFNLPKISKGKGRYNLVDIENLMTNFLPRYGPRAEAAFLIFGLSGHLETDENRKPPYCYYTDISWQILCDLVSSRSQPDSSDEADAFLLPN